MENLITLTVPADRHCALVLRSALCGVSILCNLDIDAMEDLRSALEEGFYSLISQKAGAREITLRTFTEGGLLTAQLTADADETVPGEPQQNEITKAVLATLIPDVSLTETAGGCVRSITLRVPAGKWVTCP